MESYSNAVNDLRREIAEKVEAIKTSPEMMEVVRKLPILNGLEALLNQPATSLSILFALQGSAEAAGGSVVLQPDAFVHMSALDAAKKYLHLVGKPARPFKEIIEAIKTHGGEVGREDRLKIQLVRSTTEVKKVGEDRYGLLEWYPSRRGRPVGSGGTRHAEGGDTDAATSDEQMPEIEDEEVHDEDQEENASPAANE